MVEAMDMSAPVTRGELRVELAQLEFRLEARLEAKLEEKLEEKLEAKLAQKLAHVATKADLEIWAGALLERLLTELARHARAIQETISGQISVVDEQYADLPARVDRLEATVFAPSRRRHR